MQLGMGMGMQLRYGLGRGLYILTKNGRRSLDELESSVVCFDVGGIHLRVIRADFTVEILRTAAAHSGILRVI